MKKLFFIWSTTISLLVFFSFTNNYFLSPVDQIKQFFLYLLLPITVLIFYEKPAKTCPSGLYLKKTNQLSTWLNVFFIGFIFFSCWQLVFLGPLFKIEPIIACSKMILVIITIDAISSRPIEQFNKVIDFIFYLNGIAAIGILFNLLPHIRWTYLPFGHISYLSDLLLFTIPYGFFSVTKKQKLSLKITTIILATLISLAEIKLARRADFVAIFAFVFFYFLISGIKNINSKSRQLSRIRIILPSCFLLFLFTTIGIYISKNRIVWDQKFGNQFYILKRISSTIHHLTTGSWSAETRLTIWERTITAWVAHPLSGYGYGTFHYLYPKFMGLNDKEPYLFKNPPTWLMHPHNEILFQLFEGGLIGTILFSAPFVLIFWNLFKITLRDQKNIFSAQIFWSIFAILISIQFNTAATNPMVRWCFILFFGAALALTKRNTETHTTQNSGFTLPKLMKSIVAIVAGIIILMESIISASIVRATHKLPVQALAIYKNLEIILPNHFEILSRTPATALLSHDSKLADKDSEKLLEFYPWVPFSYSIRCETLEELARFEEATDICTKGLQLFPRDQKLKNLLQDINSIY